MARLRLDPAKLVMLMAHALTQREVIVSLPEEIDIGNAAGVADELTSAASCNRVVIIDMSATRFCDCAGVRAIVRAHKRATGSGAELRLVVTAAPVRRIFDLIGVDRLLDFYPSVEAACGAMPGQASAVQHLMGAGQVIPYGKTQITPERESSAEGEV
jgi:anti-anti-sigma factor